MSNILILKNDVAGNLMKSLKLISSLNIKNSMLKIYLSELNIIFSFLNTNIHKSINKINRNV